MATRQEKIDQLTTDINTLEQNLQMNQAHFKEMEEGGSGNRFRTVTDNQSLQKTITLKRDELAREKALQRAGL